MHELSIAEAVIDLIEASAVTEKFRRVKTIFLEIGKISHIEVQALEFCFDSVSHGTLAEGAQLKIIEVAGLGHCMDCDIDVAIEQLYDPCPVCGGFRVTPQSGTEMRVKELEVE